MGLRDNPVAMVVGHVICILFAALPVQLFYFVGKPYKRGFFCDDESLRHPYHESTVTSTVLYIYGFGLPILTFIIVEILNVRLGQPNLEPQFEKPFLRYRVPSFIQNIYQNTWPFLLGATIQQMVTDIAKYTTGRLRPHFIAVCNPQYLDELCKLPYKYIVDFECNTKYTEKHLKEMRLSFPSGHSSFSMFCMLWIILYLEKRLTVPCVMLQAGKVILQSLFFYIAWFTAMSRVSDYKHHWSDVLSGMLIGSVTCAVVFTKIAPISNIKFYSCSVRQDQDPSEPLEQIQQGEDDHPSRVAETVLMRPNFGLP
ncbi:putative phosphatidate phosphatase isoform X1 [Varroa jacobsoni]|uniref:Phosphatidic acid phosphatase type 2/haloperoxidase domain-containing protein n=1 Tax=Varroa destructor TaxID=109461 RepID=A0A7M7MH32_VARDE|nr:putative phosphatidate phosphatase isoform X2 [Varroa destructor]XP_022689492.1 putative phosphatidate phosphatase isoform X1 [Varroa jacobsoni]